MTRRIPDAEKLVGNYLRDYSGIGARVVGKTPDDKSTAWIRLTQLNAANDPQVTPDYLITYFLQAECYAGETGGQPEAGTIGRMTRRALDEAKNQTLGTIYPGGSATVTNVRFTNHARIPDTEGFEPARERHILDVEVTMHNAGTATVDA